MAALTYLQSLQQGLHRAFAQDARVHLLGEDVLDPYGGAFKVTAGLSTQYPDRVFTTPISEAAIVGVSVGMAMRDLRPVAEIMFGDFLTLCADQIINHATKFHAMYNGAVPVPLVIRTPVGGGRGYGPTHSQSLEKLFLGVPNLHVVAPSHFHDPGTMLHHAILSDSRVVLFLEHKLLYPQRLVETGETLTVRLVEEASGYPTAIATNYAGGAPDVTVIGYGGMSLLAARAMENLIAEEIRVLAVFPGSLKPLPLETLVENAALSRRVVLVEEGTAGFNWGSEVSALLYERLWRQLHAPIRRLAAHDNILPAAKEMEDQALVTTEKLEAALLEVLE
ncbi:MAG TPA: transketolase C-terminal domain-containing protein [Chthonomonadaceae bacterium]|nr:transketolase C-terminal domain-containing protein [Chthonomonadaceae bacterium]